MLKRGRSLFIKKPSGKKGQVTVFIILGIVILVAIGFIFFLRDQIVEQVLGPEGTKRLLSTQLDFIDSHIKKCIDEKAKPALELLGKQGGTFIPTKYLSYYGNKVNYLCRNILNDDKCLNQMLLKSKLENELNNYLTNEILSCIDINSLKSDKFNINTGTFSLSSSIADETVLINIEYPLTLERKGITSELREFSKSINVPLGDIIKAVNDILNSEARGIDFDQFSYDLAHLGKYSIEKRRPFPDKLYIISSKSDYKFYVAIEGESNV